MASNIMRGLSIVKVALEIGDENMTEFEALGIEQRVETVRALFKLIDQQIKRFVSDICKDVGFSDENVYIRTSVEAGMYKLEILNARTTQQVDFFWSMEHFLEMCQNRDQLTMTMNTVIRKLILKLQYAEEKGIVV